MPDIYKCVRCHKMREGRFTRPRTASGRGWDKGSQLPHWYCYNCLPPGEGRGETEDTGMATTKTPVAASTTLPATQVKAVKTEGLALVQPLEQAVAHLQVTTPEEYEAADEVLGKIQRARKTWAVRMEGIIRPIRTGLDNLYSLNRDVDKPLETLEKRTKSAMVAFKTEERRLIREADEERQRETDRLTEQARQLAEKEAAARTKPMRERLAAARLSAEEQLEEVQQQTIATPTQGMNSATREAKKVRVTALAEFYAGIADGTIPDDVITINQAAINRHYKADPEAVKAWPGVEEYDDLQIVGR